VSIRFLHLVARHPPALLATLAVSAWLAALAPSETVAATVEIPFPSAPGKLTPLTFSLGYPLLTLVYDTIAWRDAAGVPRPWLARSVRAVDGGRRVVVRLRRGLRWHDGRALTAHDVAFTYELMRARRHPRFAPQLAAIATMRARDDRTVEFVLRHRSLGFLDQPLSDVPILPAHVWRGLAPGLRAPAGPPIGSGPYRVVGRRADGGVRLAAAHDYFRGRPRADRIEVPIILEGRQMLASLERGDADMLPVALTPNQASNVESISVRIARGPFYLGTMLMFNLRRAPLEDRKSVV
jgi:peptide/nickel transport system substrate-binding protein